MYINQLLDAYKEAKSYVQDKQIAHDLGISTQKLSNIRQGVRYLTESEALFIAKEIGADKEMVLVYLAADKAKSFEAQQAWESITKKFKGLGLTTITMAYTISTMTFSDVTECALRLIMLTVAIQSLKNETSSFRGFDNEVLRNDQKLYIS